jgi:UDP:flavonoid glycosyltransferase YjiC (YdhE family)
VRYLFVTFDGGGNLLPELALAGRLRDRGHDVRFLGHPSQHAAVEDAGFAFGAYQHVPAYDCTERDATPIKDWTGEEPSKVFASIRDHLIFGPAALFAADVAAELDRHPVDALAVDFFLFGALAAAEKSGLPTAVLWHTVHAPGAWWKEGLPTLNVVRAGIGLPPLGDVFEQYRRVDRVLVLTSKAFDFAITDSELPANVRHVGPQVSMPQERNGRTRGRDQRPLVLASFSTTYQAQDELLRSVADALGTLPVRALVTTGPAVRLDGELPANVEVSDWIPHDKVLPDSALLVTHAGMGTVMAGLAHGVPLLCLPMGRDQHGNAARVAHLGAGLVLSADADAEQIAEAAHTGLNDPTLKQNSERIASRIRQEIAADRAVIELETLAQRRSRAGAQQLRPGYVSAPSSQTMPS